MKFDYPMLKSLFMEKVKETGGTGCPICGQYAKIYRRRLNSTMARGLIALYKMEKPDAHQSFHHIGDIMGAIGARTQGGDFAKAAYWELIESTANEDETKRTSGMWRLTPKGRMFVRGAITVPSHAFIYNGKTQGFSETRTGIRQALHSRFNYAELMADK